MAAIVMKPLFGTNRGFNTDIELTELVSDVVIFPTNVSFINWTIYIPTGVKAKIDTSTFDPDKLTEVATNLEEYWLDWDMDGDPVQDVNNYVEGPVTVQGSISVVSGLRLHRESLTGDPVLLGLRVQ